MPHWRAIRTTVKRDAFVRGDTPCAPLGGDVMIVTHGIVNVTIMVHAQGAEPA